MKKIIKVTQEHIDKGQCGSSVFCPIALAVQDLGFKEAAVGLYIACVNGKTAYLPQVASDFVFDFDSCNPVSPFEFELEVPA